jgi:hypothetical protein
MTLTWYRLFQRNGGLNQILRRQTSYFHYGLMIPVVTITAFLTILGQIRGQKLTTLASEASTGYPSGAPELIPEF